MEQSQFIQQLIDAGYEIVVAPKTKGNLVIFQVKSNDHNDLQSSVREIRRILSPVSQSVLVNRSPTSKDPNILTVGFWTSTNSKSEEEETMAFAENSEDRPMNEFERELVDVGHKILVPANLVSSNRGRKIITMVVLAGVHPESIQFAIKEIKNILSLFSDSGDPEDIYVEPTTQGYGNQQALKIGFYLNLRLIPSFEGKDYIKEFNEAQKDKKSFLPATWDIPSEFTPNIKSSKPGELEFSPSDSKIIKQLKKPEDNSQSFPMETITLNEVKNMVSEAVLEYMNADINPVEMSQLLPEQKAEIKQKIEEGCKRQGIMSISFHDDFDKNESTVNILIDPTNRNNWIALKEEQIYKVPYTCKRALYEYASGIWKNNIK